MKKQLHFLTIFALVWFALSLPIMAATYVDEDGGTWTFDGESSTYKDDFKQYHSYFYVVIRSYSGTATVVRIPETLTNSVGTGPVCGIYAGAFTAENAPNMETIVFPMATPANKERSLYVEKNVFSDLPNLETVVCGSNSITIPTGAFANCPNLKNVYFRQGPPVNECDFGNEDLNVYMDLKDDMPDTWQGCAVKDLYADRILSQTLLVPETEGQTGQVLTSSGTSYSWQNIPVDAELDANSTNALQNKAVSTLAASLQETDKALSGDLESLQKAVESLTERIETLEGQVTALQTENQELQKANEALSKEVKATSDLLAAGNSGQVLSKAEDCTCEWVSPNSLSAEVREIKLVKGWNLVAMPGNIVFEESEEAILKDIVIYTYDKKAKVYLPSDGLEPLASYWFQAPQDCTIHFSVVDLQE